MSMSGMDMGSMSSSSSSSGSGSGHSHGGMSMDMDMGMGDCEMMMLSSSLYFPIGVRVLSFCLIVRVMRLYTQALGLSGRWKLEDHWIMFLDLFMAAQFAGTCIGVFLLVVLVESVRRWGREWDRFIVQKAVMERRKARLERRNQPSNVQTSTPFSQIQSHGRDEESAIDTRKPQTPGNATPTNKTTKDEIRQALFGRFPSSSGAGNRRALFRPTTLQQMMRSLVYAVQFAGAYIIMLIAMSFNGYILLSIVLGGLFGHFFSASDTLGMAVAVLDDEEEEIEYRMSERKLRMNYDGNGDENSVDTFERKIESSSESYGGASGACCG